MRTLFFYIGYLAFFLSACQLERTPNINNKKNALLPKEVVVNSEARFHNAPFEDWTKGIDTVFFKNVVSDILSSNVQLYDSWLYSGIPPLDSIDKVRVQEGLRKLGDSPFETILFCEKWFFDSEQFSFDKEIVSWTPTFSFNENQEEKRKVFFMIDNKEHDAFKKIAEDITYEVVFEGYTSSQYLDKEKLAHLLLDDVIKGKKAIFDLYSGETLSVDMVKKNLGARIDTVEMEDTNTGEIQLAFFEAEMEFDFVKAFIFKEDWFFDTKTQSIRKKVKAICPLRVTVEVDADEMEYERRIPIGFVKLN